MTNIRLVFLIACLFALAPAASSGQQLELRREAPPAAWAGCPVPTSVERPDEEQRLEAERLAAQATQAAILGNAAEAADLLSRAAALDPGSASIAYRLARAYDDLGETRPAMSAYCRYLGLAPDAADASEVLARIDVLSTSSGFTVTVSAADAFTAGIGFYDEGDLQSADSAFTVAATTEPGWADPVYNRAVVRLGLGQDDVAASDLRRFLELNPSADEFDRVLDVLGSLRGVPAAPYNPSRALAAGLVVPGLGHFTTDRTTTGLVVFGAATAAVGTGLAMKRVSVECLSPPVDGVCPPDQVLRENVERPWLIPGIAAAAAIGVWGAIDAYRGARRGNREAAELLRLGGDSGVRLMVALDPSSASRNELALIQLRF